MSLRTTAVVFALVFCSNGTNVLAQVITPPGAIKLVAAPKGSGTIVGNGYVEDTTKADILIFLLTGVGRANLAVYDADTTGDTLSATGNYYSVQPATFSASATSPAQILETVTVPGFGIWIVDVNYTSAVNPTPLQYIYKLTF
jgi:hypothetical protein